MGEKTGLSVTLSLQNFPEVTGRAASAAFLKAGPRHTPWSPKAAWGQNRSVPGALAVRSFSCRSGFAVAAAALRARTRRGCQAPGLCCRDLHGLPRTRSPLQALRFKHQPTRPGCKEKPLFFHQKVPKCLYLFQRSRQ